LAGGAAAGALAPGAGAGAGTGAAAGGDWARDAPAAAIPRNANSASLLDFMLAFYQKCIATLRLTIVNQRHGFACHPIEYQRRTPMGSPSTLLKRR